jgi:hypothetical protein
VRRSTSAGATGMPARYAIGARRAGPEGQWVGRSWRWCGRVLVMTQPRKVHGA